MSAGAIEHMMLGAVIIDHFPGTIRHHFVGQDTGHGVYAKESEIQPGSVLTQHKHRYDHLSILASGIAVLRVGEREEAIYAPRAIVIPKGVSHELRAITRVTWFCIHPTDETDVTKVDDVIIRKQE